jgi:hypothetical protein
MNARPPVAGRSAPLAFSNSGTPLDKPTAEVIFENAFVTAEAYIG